ncbi:hypothetical protein [uncultured Brevundimonas sp.]|uniref:hypothetical protein n=1 Tax=uncultured Brevundimonas sp. TaxID=213418 RepID=UPI0030EE647D
MTIGFQHPTAKVAMLAMALVAIPGAALAQPTAPYYERSFVLAADLRCDLFQPDVAAALSAATQQARSAALRAGTSEIDLRAAGDRALSRARSVSCADPQLATVRQRVEHAFAGWARLPRMEFPGVRASWIANRVPATGPSWILTQASVTGASPVTVGYTAGEIGDRLTAVVSFVGRPRPYAARIVMRDPKRSPRAWLGGVSDLPPTSVRRGFWAVSFGNADSALLVTGKSAGEAWRFPTEAAEALEKLDPREAFAIEFLFRDDSVASAIFEAGDFAAGRAFLSLGPLGGLAA